MQLAGCCDSGVALGGNAAAVGNTFCGGERLVASCIETSAVVNTGCCGLQLFPGIDAADSIAEIFGLQCGIAPYRLQAAGGVVDVATCRYCQIAIGNYRAAYVDQVSINAQLDVFCLRATSTVVPGAHAAGHSIGGL